jgi:multiple sugar transport system ATP-binding protein
MARSTPAHKEKALAQYIGQTITMGVRPEHLVEVSRLGDHVKGTTIPVTVDIVEQLGNENFVYLLNRPNGRRGGVEEIKLTEYESETMARTGSTLLTARMAPDVRLIRGDRIEVGAAPENLHFFDPQTEASIR